MGNVNLDDFANVLKTFCKENGNARSFDWLRGRSVSEAFVICLGAGPWKFGRRKTIADLSDAEAKQFYPLDWQNKFLLHASKTLRANNTTFEEYCRDAMKDPNTALLAIKSLVGTKDAKVISLFCRDGLKAPSFPIDRHVRRKLKELKLPTDEDSMIEVCKFCDIDPRIAAVTLVRTASDMDNPDWSINDH